MPYVPPTASRPCSSHFYSALPPVVALIKRLDGGMAGASVELSVIPSGNSQELNSWLYCKFNIITITPHNHITHYVNFLNFKFEFALYYGARWFWLRRVEMIEITAKLPRRSVFLAGETIECLVTVANVIHAGHHKGNGSIGSSTGWVLVIRDTNINNRYNVNDAVILRKLLWVTQLIRWM